jgi:hypothetical protein
MDVVLHAGDALFIPAFWFHHVQVRTYSKKKNGYGSTCAGEILRRKSANNYIK